MPYLRFYLDNIDCTLHDVHVLYWNRDKVQENLSDYKNVVFHEFLFYQEDNVDILSKIPNFIRYRYFAKKVIRKGKYDRIIFLHSFPGVLLSDVLTKKFQGQYIFDYRDHTYEKYNFFKNIIHKLVKKSCITFVSSDGFRRFMPEQCENKIYTSHNILKDSLNHRDEKRLSGVGSEKIRLAFWGFIRDEKINREIICKMANDSRFEIHYYGREQQIAWNLKSYAKEIGAENIYFHGEYLPEERYEFVRKTDLIHNVYCDSNAMIAMGNKYYDGVIFRIPQLCMSGSVMGRRAEMAGVGFSCSPMQTDYADAVYNYYNSINRNEFDMACDLELNKILQEYEQGCCIIRDFTYK